MTIQLVTRTILATSLLVGSSFATLVSHYTFDDPGNLGVDVGTFANPATTGDGDPAFTAAARIGAGALELDGDDAMFIFGAGTEMTSVDDDGDGFTVASWVHIHPALTGNSRILSLAMGGGFVGQAWGVGFNGGGGNQLLGTTYGVVDYANPAAVQKDEWHHVAYRYGFNGETSIDVIEFFVDGVSVGVTDPGPNGMNNNAGGAFSIGNLNLPGNEQYFNGRIDDLRVYDNELSNAEILMLAIPEPSSGWLFGLGLGVLLVLRKRG